MVVQMKEYPDSPVVTTDLFLTNVSHILESGSANSTLKWALLAGFVEAAPLLAGQNSIDVGTVADAVLRFYHRQSRPYPMTGVRLKQSSGGRHDLSVLTKLGEPPGGGSVTREKMAWTLAQWPSPRLQVVGGKILPLLFYVNDEWNDYMKERGSKRPLPKKLFATTAAGLPTLAPLPGAIESLLRVGPLLRDAIEFRWTAQVAQMNGLAANDPEMLLHGFLFPHETRRSFSRACRAAILTLQSEKCFWCEQPLNITDAEVDHVVPWSVSRNNAIENLVVAHRECNLAKLDYLPGPALAHKWIAYVNVHANDLATLAKAHSLESAIGLSVAWLRGRYSVEIQQGSWNAFGVVNGQPAITAVDTGLALQIVSALS